MLDDYQHVAEQYGPWARLAPRSDVQWFFDHVEGEALLQRLQPFEVVVAMRERTRFDADLISRLPNLRLLVTTGARNAAIDLEACGEHDVTVCATGGGGLGTAELTFALLLAAARQLPTELANLRRGGWMTTVGTDLAGARLGLVGLGRIGGQVARRALAFEMDVVAWSEHLSPSRCTEVGVALVGKDELFASSDFVSIHLVLSERTRGLVGERELRLMKPTAWLLNTSRGPICDEDALARACSKHEIAGACLDVFDVEPLPEHHRFRSLDNVIATPHLGYVTEQSYAVFFRDVVEDIEAFLDGHPVRVLEARRPST